MLHKINAYESEGEFHSLAVRNPILANFNYLMFRVTLWRTGILSKVEEKYSFLLHATETGLSSTLITHLAMQN